MTVTELEAPADAPEPTSEEISNHIGNNVELKRKAKVAAFVGLPGVPEGTAGKVVLVNGWDTWIRYRVLFENGADIGSLNRDVLVPVKEYAAMAAKRTEAIASGALTKAAASDDDTGDDDADGSADAAEGAVVNGVQIPARLLAMSAAARERLGVPKS